MTAKKTGTVIKSTTYTIDCGECGEQHVLDASAVHTYHTSGCDSCGYGGGRNYSYTCPKTDKNVSFMNEYED